VLLVFALMVAPGATALRLTQRVFAGIVVSMALAVIIAWISPVACLPDRLADEFLDHRFGHDRLSGQRRGATLDDPTPGRQ